jgi:putative addiction module component (TIGR02574 family)
MVDLMQLSVAERIQLVEDLWDSIASTPENVPLTDAQQTELERRLTAYRAEPSKGSSWQQVKANLRKQPRSTREYLAS